MTQNDIKEQVRSTDAKKVEVFVCGQYAPDHRIETEYVPAFAQAMLAAAQK